MRKTQPSLACKSSRDERAPTTLFVNYETPDGGVGSIRVEDDWQAAVRQAQTLGTNVMLRQVDCRTGLTVDRVRIR